MVSQTLFTEVSPPATCTSAVALSWLYTAPSILAWLVTYSCINCIGDHAVIFLLQQYCTVHMHVLLTYLHYRLLQSIQCDSCKCPVQYILLLHKEGNMHLYIECGAYHSYP